MRRLLVVLLAGLPLELHASPLADALKRYDTCVLTVSLGIPGNRFEAAERSFLACQTEEQVVRGLASSPYVNLEGALATRKMRLKSIILKDPAK